MLAKLRLVAEENKKQTKGESKVFRPRRLLKLKNWRSRTSTLVDRW